MASGIAIVIVLAIATAALQDAQRTPVNRSGQIAGIDLRYTFNEPGTLEEAGAMQQSSSPYWWLNSGGELILRNNAGETMQGGASILNLWRIRYGASNPVDTDGGLHPQNLFRLVSKNAWENISAEAHFYIVADNLSASPNRNGSNGLLLMTRYLGDGQTLYYAGIRVDGTAVIKKKYRGTYYTMARKQIFPGTYSVEPQAGTSENLLPHRQWIGLRMTTITNADTSVTITLSVQIADGEWKELLRSTDRGDSATGRTAPIAGAYYAGIRTDFMDVEFANVQFLAI